MVIKSLVIKIDRASRVPIKKQVVDEVKNLVDHGFIKANTALPSSRALADKLGISRYTVYQAYEELQIHGYLKSRQGSYNIVQKRRRTVSFDPERQSLICWEKSTNRPAEALFRNYLKNLADIPTRTSKEGHEIINLAEMQLDPALFPVDDFCRCVRQALTENGLEAMDFCGPAGHEGLREYISQRLGLHGISACPDEILITYGSQQALDLVIRLLAGREKKVVLESPTYFNILPLLQFNNAAVVAVPMKHDGMDLDELERVLNKQRVCFIYTIPNFHNPTGLTTSHHHRERLYSICLRHKVPILEDGFDEEMKYFGKLPLPIKSIDESNIVIYLGTFSKILFPGIRIGWVAADKECIKRLTAIKRFSDLRCENLTQAALASFCQRGYYDLHLKRLHRIFRNRLEVALRTMEEHFPKTVSWTKPQGGYSIWVRMPKKVTPMQLHDLMERHKVTVSPGAYYYVHESGSEHFRLSIARHGAEEIREGITRIGRALHSVAK